MLGHGKLSTNLSSFSLPFLYTCISFFFFIYLFNLFIFGCVESSLLHMGFLYLWRAGATLHCGVRASYFDDPSCYGARALGTQASVAVARGL